MIIGCYIGENEKGEKYCDIECECGRAYRWRRTVPMSKLHAAKCDHCNKKMFRLYRDDKIAIVMDALQDVGAVINNGLNRGKGGAI